MIDSENILIFDSIKLKVSLTMIELKIYQKFLSQFFQREEKSDAMKPRNIKFSILFY